MTATSEDTKYVLLKGGFAVPVEPLLLLFDLESRGFSFRIEDVRTIVVRPYSHLTEDDRESIRRWKPHLLALLAYEAPEL